MNKKLMILACIMLILIATGDSADVKKKKKTKKVTNVQADAPLPVEEKPQAQQPNSYDDYDAEINNYDEDNYKDETENEYDDNKRNNNAAAPGKWTFSKL